MGNEMMRWKSQDAAANAVSLAKDEVMERKKELDVTKEKMDNLVEKLYIGREKGLELRGAIDFHLERHRTNFGAARRRRQPPGRPTKIGGPPTKTRDVRAVSPPKRGARGGARKMDTAAKGLADDLYGTRDINRPGGRAPAGGGYSAGTGRRQDLLHRLKSPAGAERGSIDSPTRRDDERRKANTHTPNASAPPACEVRASRRRCTYPRREASRTFRDDY